MTVPTPCSLKQVAAELGISSANLSLGDSRIRALAGVLSGPVGLKQCEGKSAGGTPSIAGADSLTDAPSAHTFALSVTENFGTAPYTYLWSIVSETGAGSGFYSGSTTSKSATFIIEISPHPQTLSCLIKCAVTDSLGASKESGANTCAYTCTA